MTKLNINECPYCHSIMMLSKAPFLYHGSYIGLFEAYICHHCMRVYFTERAYEKIMRVPTSLEDFTPFEDQQSVNQISKATNLIVISNPSKLKISTISNNKLEVEQEKPEIILMQSSNFRNEKMYSNKIIPLESAI